MINPNKVLQSLQSRLEQARKAKENADISACVEECAILDKWLEAGGVYPNWELYPMATAFFISWVYGQTPVS